MKDPDAVASLLKAKRDANDEAKKTRLKLEAYEKAAKDAEDKALQESGNFKALAEQKDAEAKAARKDKADALISYRMELEAVKAGAIDPADVEALCNKSGIKLGDDGKTVTGVTEAVMARKAAKPHLFKSDIAGTTVVLNDKRPGLNKVDALAGKTPLELLNIAQERTQGENVRTITQK